MKKILTSALAIVLFTGASQAQATAPENGYQHGRGKEMMKDLNLTDAQKTQLKNIHQAEKKEMDELKGKGNVTPEQRKALHQKYKTQSDAVFTPEQRENIKNKMQERKAEGGEKGGHGFGRKEGEAGRMTPFMNKELNLTADQQAKLKSYSDDFRAKAKDLRTNTGLTEDQKKEQMHNLSKTYTEQSRTVLTPEQQQKMKELKGQRRNRANANT